MTAPFVREDGFYWVKFRGFPNAKTIVGLWRDGWMFAGTTASRTEAEIEVCSKRILPPDQAKKEDTGFLVNRTKNVETRPVFERIPGRNEVSVRYEPVVPVDDAFHPADEEGPRLRRSETHQRMAHRTERAPTVTTKLVHLEIANNQEEIIVLEKQASEQPPADPTITFTYEEVMELREVSRRNGYTQATHAAARVAEEEKRNRDSTVYEPLEAERRDGAFDAADNIATNIRQLLQNKETI